MYGAVQTKIQKSYLFLKKIVLKKPEVTFCEVRFICQLPASTLIFQLYIMLFSLIYFNSKYMVNRKTNHEFHSVSVKC